jgi:hypothetical protein
MARDEFSQTASGDLPAASRAKLAVAPSSLLFSDTDLLRKIRAQRNEHSTRGVRSIGRGRNAREEFRRMLFRQRR